MACIFEDYRSNIRTNQESLFLYGCSTYPELMYQNQDPRKEPIIFLRMRPLPNKVFCHRGGLHWKGHKFCRFDTPISLVESLCCLAASIKPGLSTGQVEARYGWPCFPCLFTFYQKWPPCAYHAYLILLFWNPEMIIQSSNTDLFDGLHGFCMVNLFVFFQPGALIFLFALFRTSAGCDRSGASLPRCHCECKFYTILFRRCCLKHPHVSLIA